MENNRYLLGKPPHHPPDASAGNVNPQFIRRTQARYYAAKQGRFTSPDPLLASGRAARPQSWNRYSYVLNNPLRLVDPSGLSDKPADGGAQQGQPDSNQPPPPPPVDFKQPPLTCTFGEHEDGGVTVAAGAEVVTVAVPNAAAKILDGVYRNSYYSNYPEAARDAVESRTGTVEPGGQAVTRTESKSAELQSTVAEKSSAGVKVGVTGSGSQTQNFSLLPRLEGEIQTRASVLTYNDNAISALAKIEVKVTHHGVSAKIPIGVMLATKMVAGAAGMGQHAAKESTRNALGTVP